MGIAIAGTRSANKLNLITDDEAAWSRVVNKLWGDDEVDPASYSKADPHFSVTADVCMFVLIFGWAFLILSASSQYKLSGVCLMVHPVSS